MAHGGLFMESADKLSGISTAPSQNEKGGRSNRLELRMSGQMRTPDRLNVEPHACGVPP